MKLPEELKEYARDYLTTSEKMSLSKALVKYCAKICEIDIGKQYPVTGGQRDVACRCANAILEQFDIQEDAPSLQITDHGISVNVGADGAWVFFRTKGGKSFAFQPIQQWATDKTFGPVIDEWCRELQQRYEDS